MFDTKKITFLISIKVHFTKKNKNFFNQNFQFYFIVDKKDLIKPNSELRQNLGSTVVDTAFKRFVFKVNQLANHFHFLLKLF